MAIFEITIIKEMLVDIYNILKRSLSNVPFVITYRYLVLGLSYLYICLCVLKLKRLKYYITESHSHYFQQINSYIRNIFHLYVLYLKYCLKINSLRRILQSCKNKAYKLANVININKILYRLKSHLKHIFQSQFH